MVKIKKCSKCQTVKPLDDFANHNKFGKRYWCKACEIDYKIQRRKNDPEYRKKYDDYQAYYQQRPEVKARMKAYSQRPEVKNRMREYQKKYSKTPEAKARQIEYQRKYRATNKLQTLARYKVQSAVRNGTLIPTPCSSCGSPEQLHGHHPDYNKPLEVIWLCAECHYKRHRKIQQKL